MRCSICNKKLKPIETAMRCKCGASVCKAHRFPDQHDCPHDFKRERREALKRELIRVKRDKVVRI